MNHIEFLGFKSISLGFELILQFKIPNYSSLKTTDSISNFLNFLMKIVPYIIFAQVQDLQKMLINQYSTKAGIQLVQN